MGSKDGGDQPGQPRWCGMVRGTLVMCSPECTCLTASSRRPARIARYSSLPPNNSCHIKVTCFRRVVRKNRAFNRTIKHMSSHLPVCLVIIAKLLGDQLTAIWTPFDFCYPPLHPSLLWLRQQILMSILWSRRSSTCAQILSRYPVLSTARILPMRH